MVAPAIDGFRFFPPVHYTAPSPPGQAKKPKRGKKLVALLPVLVLFPLNMSVNIPNKQYGNRDEGAIGDQEHKRGRVQFNGFKRTVGNEPEAQRQVLQKNKGNYREAAER